MSALANIAQEWKQASPGGKALAITAVIAVAGLGLYTASKNKGSSVTPNVSLLPIGSDSSSSISSPTTSTPSPITNLLGIIRAKTGDKYDATHMGIPLTSSPGGKGIGTIPFGAKVTIDNNPISGPKSPQGGTTYYHVTYNGLTGYVSSYDLPTIGSASLPLIGSIIPAPSLTYTPYNGVL